MRFGIRLHVIVRETESEAWDAADALADLDADAPVLLIGTGLTMVDMVLSLSDRQHRGKIYAVSRRGLFPLKHQGAQPYPCFLMTKPYPCFLMTKADRSLVGGEILEVGSVIIETIFTPGHSASHITYLVNKTHLLTGDALFIRGCGRTDFQGGDPGTLYDVVRQHLFTLPDDTLVYPAHDYKGRTVSTIGEEKRLNSRFSDSYGALRDRSRSQFITIMNNLQLSYPQKMNATVPANEYCGDFIPQESLDPATSSATDEEQKQIELTVMTNTEIYNDYFAMYI